MPSRKVLISLFELLVVPILTSLLALGMTLVLWPVIHDSQFVLFTLAVTVSAWRGGIRAGLISATLAIIAIDYYLVISGFIVQDVTNIFQSSIFFLVAVFISWLENNRMVAERTAREARQELETILATIADGISVQDASGKVLYINQAALELTSFGNPQQILNVPAEILRQRYTMHDSNGLPMDWSALPRFQVFKTGAVSEINFELRDAQSLKSRWMHIKAAPIFDPQGKVRLAVNIFRDITERQRIEVTLRMQQQRQRKIIDNLFVFVAILTPDGTLFEVNRTSIELADVNYKDVVGRPVEETYWWAYSPIAQAQVRDAIKRAAAGEQVRYEARIQIANHQEITIDFRMSPLFNDNNEVELLISSGIDITEQVAIHKERADLLIALEAQKNRLGRIIHNLPAIVYENYHDNGNQVVTFVSPRAENMLGYTLEEWYDPQFWAKIFYPPDVERVTQEVLEIIKTGEPRTVQFRVFNKNGQVVPLESTSMVTTDAVTKRMSSIGVISDITARKTNEEALTYYAAQLHRSNLELQQFAYIASHDLQEPLRMVTSYLQLIEKRYGDLLDKDGHEFIGFAVDGALRMKKLINDLLTYSRVQSTDQKWDSFDVQSAITTAQANLKVQLEENNVEITLDAMPTVRADQSQIVQVFQNLINNAVKYRREIPCKIHISVKKDENYWTFAVQDNGIGIEAQYLDRIFVLFHRIFREGDNPGAGIGLSICKKIVERYNGRIWAESEVGVDTTIYFTLPIA